MSNINLWWRVLRYVSGTGEVMRRHPENLRSVILEAVYPPDVDLYTSIPGNFYRSLVLLFKNCTANTVCNQNFPDLRNVLFDTVEWLNAKPILQRIKRSFDR